MAHFAQLDGTEVIQVIVVDNKDCGGGDFPDSEPVGQAFIADLGLDGYWIQTSYNGTFRLRMAGVGYIYDADADVFYPQSPGPDWELDRETFQWVNSGGTRLPGNGKGA